MYRAILLPQAASGADYIQSHIVDVIEEVDGKAIVQSPFDGNQTRVSLLHLERISVYDALEVHPSVAPRIRDPTHPPVLGLAMFDSVASEPSDLSVFKYDIVGGVKRG